MIVMTARPMSPAEIEAAEEVWVHDQLTAAAHHLGLAPWTIAAAIDLHTCRECWALPTAGGLPTQRDGEALGAADWCICEGHPHTSTTGVGPCMAGDLSCDCEGRPNPGAAEDPSC